MKSMTYIESSVISYHTTVVNGMDYLLTWNFKHINNAETRDRIAKFIENEGYICPVLCSPEELGGTA